MDQKAKINFNPETETLTLEGEFLPVNPVEHDALVKLLSGEHTFSFSTDDDRNVITYKLVIEKTDLPSEADLDAAVAEDELKKKTGKIDEGKLSPEEPTL